MFDTVIRVENISKLYRLGEVGTGSLAHDLNRWWHKVRGKEDPYLKIGEVNDRTKPAKQAVASSELLVASQNTPAEGAAEHATGNQSPATAPQGGAPATSYSLPVTPKAAPSDWVYALKDVSFEVKRGEVLGIIGRNGAGKSTLLKILSRVTTQSEGRIKVKGRIASLLEVGTGFHPELTGRENIFLNGAILGMRKAEIARKFDEIVEFSGCARYIDTPVTQAAGQPLGRLPQGSPKGETSGSERINLYSSGMYVRLAFAVAAHLEPEILIVDEVLAVGDAEFQKKCLGKMKDVAGHGRTILWN
jgi:lipopolysaccharide transport system ATP-binding protein